VVFMENADLGISMVVAPAYLIYRKVSTIWSFFTFGMAEYAFQLAALLLMVLIIQKFRPYFLFTFITTFLYGLVLDFFMLVLPVPDISSIGTRIFFFVFGQLICSVAIAFFFHTYISPQVYELFVKEIASHFNFNISRVKTIYDCTSFTLGVIFSFAFFGFGVFEGIKWGTLICAVFNGKIIGFFSSTLEKYFDFKDRFPLKKYFG
ncbi:MAG: hypothetical protein IKU12_04170, partial [Oscillospiraceae bacterium]|nr:hypothetical protein [Oscillospiraceae bacterium]